MEAVRALKREGTGELQVHGSPGPAGEAQSLGAWALAGIEAGVHDRWRASLRLGYLGGLDSRILITDLTHVTGPAIHLLVGHVYLEPTSADSSATSALRAGGIWLPLRGLLALDNRFLVERRSSHTTSVSVRGRDRLRLSSWLGSPLQLRVFGSVETFAVHGHGLTEHRYQVGVIRPAGRATAEIYWLQRRARLRPVFNTIGLSLLWRIGTA